MLDNDRKHLIFDFDGTIVNSFPLVVKNLSQYTNHDDLIWKELRSLSSRQVIKKLGISKLATLSLILRVRKDFKNNITDQTIVSGIKDAFMELRAKGFTLHIVSTNSKTNIERFLSLHDLRESVTNIISSFSIFGKAKGISKLIKKIDKIAKDVIYIGDETRDIQAAEKAGARCLAVSWGYSSEELLKQYNPWLLASNPREMVDKIGKVFL